MDQNVWATTRFTLFDGIDPSAVELPAALPSNVVALGARKASNVRSSPKRTRSHDDPATAARGRRAYVEAMISVAPMRM